VRKGKLTASNFGVACGLSKYATPSSYWEKMTGRIQEDSVTEGQRENMDRGNRLEPKVREVYQQVMGV
jgi:predicted phage-related endonuclease